MTRQSFPPRWRAPALLIVIALTVLVIVGATHGWTKALEAVPIPLLVGIWLYVNAGRDTDYGALLRRELDERQQMMRTRMFALSGRVLSLAIVAVYIATIVAKTTLWPSATLLGVMAVTLIVGLLSYSRGGAGSDDDAL